MKVPCEGQYRRCGKLAIYRVTARSHEEPIKNVCKTHVSWALSHTAYMRGDVAEVVRIKDENE